MIESIISGLVSGAGYAILGVCVVTLFRAVGVLNFSQASIGTLGAYTTIVLANANVNLLLAVLAGLGVSALTGLLAGYLMAHWFANATVAVKSAVTIALLIVLLALGFRLFGNDPRVTPDVVPATSFGVFGVVVTLGTVIAIAVAIAVAVGVTLVLSRTRTGLRLRAISERPITAELLGIRANRFSILVWVATAAFACLAILFVAPTLSPTYLTLSFLIVPAMAAGLVGRLQSLPLTIIGGLLIGALQGLGARIPFFADYRDVIPLLVIVLALLWSRRNEVWDVAR
ncbi:MAG TPA: branched-chain amino acid ABC transporter permease [Mycobacterium sp.]|nr:branched-chain amino acid ABC transporter permease [Mycobacterium sp.]